MIPSLVGGGTPSSIKEDVSTSSLSAVGITTTVCDGELLPCALVAVTEHSYAVPLVKLITAVVVTNEPAVMSVPPPQFILYPVIGVPPS